MITAETPSQQQNDPVPGRYRIDTEHSTVTIRTRHVFGLAPVRATLTLRDGRIQVAAPPEASAVRACFAASTFRSGSAARDAAVVSARFLDAEAYPRLVFTSTGLAWAQDHWVLRGEFEVRGVTRLVEAHLGSVSEDGGTLRATARVAIDRYDFGITASRGLAARRLTVDLVVTAHREARA